MTDGIVSDRQDLLLRLAYRIQTSMPGWESGDTGGTGSHETRPEYSTIYTCCEFKAHPNGTLHALVWTDPAAREKFAALRTDIAARETAGTTTQDERDWAALPEESELNPAWDEAAVPP